MTLQETCPQSDQHGVPSKYPPRLTLTPKDRGVGGVGGAWWPRSRDLGTELPDLLAVLADGLGRVERVVYDPAGWAAAPELLVAGDGAVTLDAYLYESFDKLYAYGINGASIVLRVIPAATDGGAAHSALMAVADTSGQQL